MPILTNGKFYHIYNHAVGSENIFREPENYRYFLSQWKKYISPIADTSCYCLLPNHFHFLIRMKSKAELIQFGTENLDKFFSQQFSNFFNSYAKAYNKRYERLGSLFLKPFRAKEVENEDYLSRLVFYIDHNPIHHGFESKIESWRYSSYLSILSNDQTFIQSEEIINWFGSRRDFIDFHRQPIGKFKG